MGFIKEGIPTRAAGLTVRHCKMATQSNKELKKQINKRIESLEIKGLELGKFGFRVTLLLEDTRNDAHRTFRSSKDLKLPLPDEIVSTAQHTILIGILNSGRQLSDPKSTHRLPDDVEKTLMKRKSRSERVKKKRLRRPRTNIKDDSTAEEQNPDKRLESLAIDDMLFIPEPPSFGSP